MTRTDCRWSCTSKMKKTRKPGGGRRKLKPEYDAGKNLKEQMESAVALYDLRALDDMFKQAEAAPEMTLEEINAEIADVRSARKAAR